MAGATHTKPAREIKVLVVEASDATRALLVRLLQSDGEIRVMDAFGRAQAALDFLQCSRPDLMLMAHRMPDLDGFETTRRIMEMHPLPIVLYAESTTADDTMFRSLEAGAVACIEKPREGAMDGEALDDVATRLVQTVKLMSEITVVRRWARDRSAKNARSSRNTGCRVVGIGASTGGPLALQTIFASLPRNFPVPILVVQHIARGFLPGMCEWLRQTSGLQVQIGAHGLRAEPGHVYLAPDDFHMGYGAGDRIVLTREPVVDGLRPSVSYLFHSLAEQYGSGAVGVLLTGMGKDGAQELKRMRDAGAATVAQDRASSVVHGMPSAAISIGGAGHVAPLEKIAGLLVALVNTHGRNEKNDHGPTHPT